MPKSPDFIAAKRHAALGTRLRRLSEALDRQVQALYREHDAGFEPRWYPVVVALLEHGPLNVGELAAMIGITHAAVSQVRAELVKAGLVKVKADRADKRRQILELSAKGRRETEKLAPLWRAIALAGEALCAAEAPDLLAALDRVEDALSRVPMSARVARHFKHQPGKTTGTADAYLKAD